MIMKPTLLYNYKKAIGWLDENVCIQSTKDFHLTIL